MKLYAISKYLPPEKRKRNFFFRFHIPALLVSFLLALVIWIVLYKIG